MVLEVSGFPLRFVHWIEECITNAQFSIKVNGGLCGFFLPERGLRQGDSLSPYLFALVMEVFSRLMDKATRDPESDFHWRCKRIRLSHLVLLMTSLY